jgi:hypothetical protein
MTSDVIKAMAPFPSLNKNPSKNIITSAVAQKHE